MNGPSEQESELIASARGWPEGPTARPDGSIVLVESYRSQLTLVGQVGQPRRFAYVAGALNSCVLGADDEFYVCQNGGSIGPWHVPKIPMPSIQRVREGSKPEILLTEVAGIALRGPNNLVFAAEGRLIFTDPGTYSPADPDPSTIFALAPDNGASVLAVFSEPVFPSGIAVDADRSILWAESYTGYVGQCTRTARSRTSGGCRARTPLRTA